MSVVSPPTVCGFCSVKFVLHRKTWINSLRTWYLQRLYNNAAVSLLSRLHTSLESILSARVVRCLQFGWVRILGPLEHIRARSCADNPCREVPQFILTRVPNLQHSKVLHNGGTAAIMSMDVQRLSPSAVAPTTTGRQASVNSLWWEKLKLIPRWYCFHLCSSAPDFEQHLYWFAEFLYPTLPVSVGSFQFHCPRFRWLRSFRIPRAGVLGRARSAIIGHSFILADVSSVYALDAILSFSSRRQYLSELLSLQ